MNIWKIIIGTCFIGLIFICLYEAYVIVDQAVTINYMQESYSDSDDDLNILIQLINDTNLSKVQIEKMLNERFSGAYVERENILHLKRISLHFKDEQLNHINTKW